MKRSGITKYTIEKDIWEVMYCKHLPNNLDYEVDIFLGIKLFWLQSKIKIEINKTRSERTFIVNLNKPTRFCLLITP